MAALTLIIIALSVAATPTVATTMTSSLTDGEEAENESTGHEDVIEFVFGLCPLGVISNMAKSSRLKILFSGTYNR